MPYRCGTYRLALELPRVLRPWPDTGPLPTEEVSKPRRRKQFDVLLKYARMRHVERSMRPYLEAMP